MDDDVGLRMQEQAGLLPDGLDHAGMAMPCVRDPDATGEVQKRTAVDGVDI
jgi:hypothetical protein